MFNPNSSKPTRSTSALHGQAQLNSTTKSPRLHRALRKLPGYRFRGSDQGCSIFASPLKNIFYPLRDTQIAVCSLSHVDAGTDCPLCDFFSDMKSKLSEIGGLSHGLYSISARKFESLDQSQNWSPELDAVLFYVNQSLSKFILGPTFEVVEKSNAKLRSRKLVLDSSGPIDWNQIKGWLLHCNNTHGIGNLTQQHDKACQAVDFCPNLKVLDCETRRIVDLPSDSTPYVALSYLVSGRHCYSKSPMEILERGFVYSDRMLFSEDNHRGMM